MLDQVNVFVAKYGGYLAIYLLVIKVLTAVQDAVDAEPKDLKPPFGKAIYYLTAIGGYLGIGNRIQPIQKTGV